MDVDEFGSVSIEEMVVFACKESRTHPLFCEDDIVWMQYPHNQEQSFGLLCDILRPFYLCRMYVISCSTTWSEDRRDGRVTEEQNAWSSAPPRPLGLRHTCLYYSWDSVLAK